MKRYEAEYVDLERGNRVKVRKSDDLPVVRQWMADRLRARNSNSYYGSIIDNVADAVIFRENFHSEIVDETI